MDTIPSAPRVPRRRVLGVGLAAAATALTLPLLAAPQATAAPTTSAPHAGPTTPSGGQRHHATPAEVTLPDGLQPEGITSGPGARYYVGSLADGRIVTGNLRRGTSRVLLPGATGRSLRGLYFDPRTALVWAVGSVGAEGHVWAVDSRSGKVVQDTVVPGAVFLNDLVVTRRAVWVTDSNVDRLTVVPLRRNGHPSGAGPSFVPLTGEWPAGDGTAINANGIRRLPDGTAILNNSRVGGLWQVDPRTGVTRQVPVTGGPGLTSGDGLELRGRTVYDVRGSGMDAVSVLRLHRSGDGWTATWRRDLEDPRLDVPSTATLVGGTLWAVNARFGVASPATADYWITPLALHR